jgi:hypothetical protein
MKDVDVHDEEPSPSRQPVHTVEIDVGGRLKIARKHGSQGPGDVEERQASRYFGAFIPTADAVG